MNTPLINQVQLNRDFGGLFIIVLVKNGIALLLELITREVVTTEVYPK